MNGSTHVSVTRAIFTAGLPPLMRPFAEEVAKNADLPDRMSDITVGRFGTKIAGRNIGSLTHFIVPTSGGHFRGYCWRSDRSLWHCIRRFDPRVGDVGCRTDPWVPVVGADAAKMHPLAVLIRDLGGKASLDADEFTFPTGAIMAEWVWSEELRPAPFNPTPSPKRVGAVCHWIQDASCLWHSRGWLGNGHSKGERSIHAEWVRSDHRDLLLAATSLLDPASVPTMPRAIVEAAATMSSPMTGATPRETIIMAMAWTMAFLRNCVLGAL